jgi:hypothetical protein
VCWSLNLGLGDVSGEGCIFVSLLRFSYRCVVWYDCLISTDSTPSSRVPKGSRNYAALRLMYCDIIHNILRESFNIIIIVIFQVHDSQSPQLTILSNPRHIFDLEVELECMI